MNELQIRKLLRSVERKMLQISERGYGNLSDAKQYERAMCQLLHRTNQFQSKNNLDIYTRSKLNEVRDFCQLSIKEAAEFILDNYNGLYGISFRVDDVIAGSEEEFFQKGLDHILKKKNVIRKLFHEEFQNISPGHPAEEYRDARMMERLFVIHEGPTNSGKTYEAIQAMKNAESGIYLSPLRLLALEFYEKLNEQNVLCDLVTGEEEVLYPFARHEARTIEKLPFNKVYDVAIIDEAQLISDEVRGNAWFRAILGVQAKEVHVCCSPIATNLLVKLIKECGDQVDVITHQRRTPVDFKKEFCFPSDLEKGDALIVFSRKKALNIASHIKALGISASVIYGNLPPETRRKQVELFVEGKHDVIVSTDAIGMGLNLPVKRIIFLESTKYDGNTHRELTVQEVKQIGGRAGRDGLYQKGEVCAPGSEEFIHSRWFSTEDPVQSGILGPSEQVIMSISFGSLEERLDGWLTYPSLYPHIRYGGAEVLANRLNMMDPYAREHLSMEEAFRAIQLSFDDSETELVDEWNRMLVRHAKGLIKVKKPKVSGADLYHLELYYRKLELYFSFAKNFEYTIDEHWLHRERFSVSNDIHALLLDHIYDI